MCDLVLLLECEKLKFSEYQFSKIKVGNSFVALKQKLTEELEQTWPLLSVHNIADHC